MASDMDQTERILGLRETGFGDAALEQLPDPIREKIQKLGPDLRNRKSPATHLALAFLAEQNGDLSQAAGESGLAASAINHDIAGNCSEADVNRALDREEFFRITPCASTVLTARTPAPFAFE